MSLVVDTAPLVVLGTPDHPQRAAVTALLQAEPGDLVITGQVTAEVDYLLSERVGTAARRRFLDDLVAGRFTFFCLEPSDYELARTFDRQYAGLNLGLADLSIVVAAFRTGTRRILTYDQRHFRAIRPLDGGSYVILPADGPG